MLEGTVFLVDDNDAFRQSTQWLLSSYGLRVEEFRDGPSFLTRYAASPGARDRECLLLDVRMPGLTGLQVQEELLAREVDVPVIFITAHADVPLAVQAMRRGAFDFLEKPFTDQALIEAIGSALAREDARLVRDRESGNVRANLQSLTPRERQVLDLVVEGALNKTVADKLGISVKTVELHRSRVMEKMRAQSLAQLIQMIVQVRA
jgi:two-component system, LuxR family, response regulator FixJ